MILREQYLANYARTSFARLHGAVEVSIIPRDVHEKLTKIIEERDPELVKRYYPQGMIPAQLLGERLIVSFCPAIMTEQTEGMDDDEATNWLAYWITRMFIRLTKQAVLREVSGNMPDEKILEEMVEDQIRAEAGLQDESS